MSKEIVKCVIHPAIGIARVGNSVDGYYIGPEVPGAAPDALGGFKDDSGCIKRQVARFRIFGLDADDNVVRELNATDADVNTLEWTVHLANKKSAWFDFVLALDIPVAAEENVATPLRNKTIVDREELVIDPGPCRISGTLTRALIEPGKFMGTDVRLGELRTDRDGNLLVFGGLGQSASYNNQPATTFGNNEGWHDDTSDGPVHARVVLNGKEIEVTPAWVLVAPPDYAPGVLGAVTLYDIVYDVAVGMDASLKPDKVSFTEHILPILERLNRNQWVNQGFYQQFGWQAPENFLAPELLAELASNSPETKAKREEIFAQFRNPGDTTPPVTMNSLPPMYGDGMHEKVRNASEMLAVTAIQYDWLTGWAAGDFVADLTPEQLADADRDRVNTIKYEDIPLADRPQALDRAALEHALGGAFHPGCEVTWPMRHASMYAAPFRIKAAPVGTPEPVYPLDATLTPENIYAPNGPLTNNRPGDLTRWMAVPWQTDTSSCRFAYEDDPANPYLPTFWPARVPNQVLSADDYKVVMDTSVPLDVRKAAFANRLDWLRDFPADTNAEYLTSINAFVQKWSELGIVVRNPGPQDQLDFPAVIHVETGYSVKETTAAETEKPSVARDGQ